MVLYLLYRVLKRGSLGFVGFIRGRRVPQVQGLDHVTALRLKLQGP